MKLPLFQLDEYWMTSKVYGYIIHGLAGYGIARLIIDIYEKAQNRNKNQINI